MTLCDHIYHHRPPPVSRLETGAVRVQMVAEFTVSPRQSVTYRQEREGSSYTGCLVLSTHSSLLRFQPDLQLQPHQPSNCSAYNGANSRKGRCNSSNRLHAISALLSGNMAGM